MDVGHEPTTCHVSGFLSVSMYLVFHANSRIWIGIRGLRSLLCAGAAAVAVCVRRLLAAHCKLLYSHDCLINSRFQLALGHEVPVELRSLFNSMDSRALTHRTSVALPAGVSLLSQRSAKGAMVGVVA